MIKSKTLMAIPPGYTIKEQLEDRELTQKEFASRMEMSEKHISKLINGEVALTIEVALRLEMVLGLPAQFWMNLETRYREKIAKIELENNMDADIEIAKKFPYAQMTALEWVPDVKSKNEKVICLRKYFEVNRLGLLLENKSLNILYRRIGENEKSYFSLMAWAQQAKLQSRNIDVKSINIKGLKDAIAIFRKMTRQNPDVFQNEITNILLNNGISLVILPHIPNSFLHGATFYDNNKIIIGLTVRGKDADKFWFSFFHELGHIILGHINKDYYEQMENEADDFAKNTLIPNDKFNEFVSSRTFTERKIIDFSNEIEIDYGIVVGRLQKEGYIPFTKFNNLKTQYTIS